METTAKNRNAWVWDVLAVGLALFGLWHVAQVLPSRANGNDFAHYYITSRLLLTGGDVYSTPLQPEYERLGFRFAHMIPTATNPPLLVGIFAPFAALSPRAAFWAWAAFEIFCLGYLLTLTWRLTSPQLSVHSRNLVCAGIIASAPVYWHFFFSQSQLLVAAMILVAYKSLRNGRPEIACLVVATTAWLKLYPVMLLPWFLWRASAEWKVRCKCGGIVLGWSIVVVLATGPELWRQFWVHSMVVFRAWAEWQRHFNFTVPSFIKNTVWSLHGFSPEWDGLHAWARTGALAGVTLILMMYGICWWTSRREKEANVESEFCLLSIAMLAGIAEGWGHYYVMLAYPVAVAVARVVQRPTMGRGVMLGVSFAMVNVMGNWQISKLEFVVSYTPLYGLLLLGAFFVNEMLDSRPTTASPTTFVPPTS